MIDNAEDKKPCILGLITARGGSIRLPRKNAKMFCGHPLVAWSIIASRCSRLIDLTVLTTDDDEIAKIGNDYGALVIRRPVLDNDVTAGVVFKMAVEELEKQGYKFDEIVCMLPTSPLKKPSDIDNMILSYHTINRFKEVEENEMAILSPDRECFVYKNIDDMTTNYGSPYYVNLAIANKNWEYSKLGGGWGIAKRDYLMRIWGSQGQFDSDIDKKLEQVMFDGRKNILAYSIEPWQCFETDYECYFHICEVLMEEFILKGQGMDVFTRYAREFRKIVDYHIDNANIDINKYVGNINQLGEDNAR